MEGDACNRLTVGLQCMARRRSREPARGVLVSAEEGCRRCGVQFVLESLTALF
jgi:hypothetical protein